jgi:hypothetical protein
MTLLHGVTFRASEKAAALFIYTGIRSEKLGENKIQ